MSHLTVETDILTQKNEVKSGEKIERKKIKFYKAIGYSLLLQTSVKMCMMIEIAYNLGS